MIEYGFWNTLKKPVFAVAPMAGVTDAAFRRILAQYGKPDVMWTEFVSCDGLCSPGKNALMQDFLFDQIERPIVAQIFGATPEHFYRTAMMVRELGFDGIDINMGCPEKNVQKQGAGAKLIQNPELAKKIVMETKRGAGNLPVSVKTRIGYNKNTIDEWLPHVFAMEPATITIHGRTKKEMSAVPAHWDIIAHAVMMRDKYYTNKTQPLLLGNGDVQSLEEAMQKVTKYGVDGVMIGRGLFGTPWFFEEKDVIKTTGQRNAPERSLAQKMHIMLEHTELFEQLFGHTKRFEVMKKHYKAYIQGFDGAKELRMKLMAAHTAQEVRAIMQASTILK